MPASADYFEQQVGSAIDNREELKQLMTYAEYAGNPTNNLVPDFIGQHCLDTSGSNFYIATTAISSGWAVIHA